MGLLSWLLDLDDITTPEEKAKRAGMNSDFKEKYDAYYEDLYNDAMSGDEDAIEEMRGEFGDDWEDEY